MKFISNYSSDLLSFKQFTTNLYTMFLTCVYYHTCKSLKYIFAILLQNTIKAHAMYATCKDLYKLTNLIETNNTNFRTSKVEAIR